MKPFAVVLIAVAWTAPLKAQDTTQFAADAATTPEPHPYRRPRLALILGSLIPGAGHIYAGEYWHGIMNYEATVGSIGMGVMTYMVDGCTFSFLSMTKCDPGPQWPHQTLGVALVGAGLWKWVSSARDAPRAAERANEKHHRMMMQAKPIIQPAVGGHGDWRAGVMIPW